MALAALASTPTRASTNVIFTSFQPCPTPKSQDDSLPQRILGTQHTPSQTVTVALRKVTWMDPMSEEFMAIQSCAQLTLCALMLNASQQQQRMGHFHGRCSYDAFGEPSFTIRMGNIISA